MGLKIEAHQIHETEDARLGCTDRAAHHRVGLLHRQAKFTCGRNCSLYPEDADAVGDKSRRVLGLHHCLAKPFVGEGRNGTDDFGPCRAAAHDFKQTHVAGRIEEVGDAKVPDDTFRHSCHQHFQGKRRGV